MPASSRWTGVSAISSRSPRPTAISRCTPCCSDRTARRSVQIRTEEMDLIAERGVAAHWTYKVGSASPNSAQSRAHDWIVELIDSQRAAGSSLEFLDNVKVDLFPDEVYLFTPKGKILALPRNSTALDFAYAVHTDVGNRAVASRVDKSWCRCAPSWSAARRWRSSRRVRPRPSPSGWSSWSAARRARRSVTSSSSSNTKTPCSWVTACWTARWKRWTPRWSGCPKVAWTPFSTSTAIRVWKRCWPMWRSAT